VRRQLWRYVHSVCLKSKSAWPLGHNRRINLRPRVWIKSSVDDVSACWKVCRLYLSRLIIVSVVDAVLSDIIHVPYGVRPLRSPTRTSAFEKRIDDFRNKPCLSTVQNRCRFSSLDGSQYYYYSLSRTHKIRVRFYEYGRNVAVVVTTLG